MVDAYFPSGDTEHLDLKENIEKLVKSGKVYEVISKELKDQHPDSYGLSARSLRRFCCDHRIDKKSLMEKEKLGSIVKEKVLKIIVNVSTFVKF